MESPRTTDDPTAGIGPARLQRWYIGTGGRRLRLARCRPPLRFPEALLGTRQALFRSRAIHGRGNGGKVDCARGSGRSALPGMEGLSLLAKHRGKADVATPLGNSEKNALQQDSKIWAVNQCLSVWEAGQ